MSETKRELVWSNVALARLIEIRDGLAEKDPRAARRLLHLLLERAGQLVDFPNLGRVVPELPESRLRELVEKQYRIVYRVSETTVEIATVFEGYREFPAGDVGGEGSGPTSGRQPRKNV